MSLPIGRIVIAADGTLGTVCERPTKGPEADAKILDSPEWVYVRWPSGWVERVWIKTLTEMRYVRS